MLQNTVARHCDLTIGVEIREHFSKKSRSTKRRQWPLPNFLVLVKTEFEPREAGVVLRHPRRELAVHLVDPKVRGGLTGRSGCSGCCGWSG